jgi:hypothetical protein
VRRDTEASSAKIISSDGRVNLGLVARRFELSSGMIKTSWISALGLMVHRKEEAIVQETL